MSRIHTLLILAGALALGLAVGPHLAPTAAGDLVTRASWKDIFDTPAALAKGVDAIALVTAGSTEPSRSVAGDYDSSPVSFVLNHFIVNEALKGGLTPGAQITVEQTAERHGDGALVGIDSDGGPYVGGQQYLVYLQRQAGTGYWYVVSFQGRYNIEAGRLVGVHAHDPVVQAIQFQTVAQALAAVRGHLGTGVIRGSTD